MPLASIDVGSNSVRMLIGEVSGKSIRHPRYERSATRLARGIAASGLLDGPAIEKTIEVLVLYSGIMRSAGVSNVRCVGTSALREAANSPEFLSRAREEAGIAVDVISGEEEARLTAKGVISSLGVGPSAVIADIGGGSTEIIFIREGRMKEAFTVPVGVVKLHDTNIRSDPPSKDELIALEAETKSMTSDVAGRLKGMLGYAPSFIATAGTATSLAALDLGLEEYDRDRVHGHVISLERLKEMYLMLSSMALSRRAALRGLEPARADLILTGIKLTINLMESLGAGDVAVSGSGLLEGTLIELSGEVSK